MIAAAPKRRGRQADRASHGEAHSRRLAFAPVAAFGTGSICATVAFVTGPPKLEGQARRGQSAVASFLSRVQPEKRRPLAQTALLARHTSSAPTRSAKRRCRAARPRNRGEKL